MGGEQKSGPCSSGKSNLSCGEIIKYFGSTLFSTACLAVIVYGIGDNHATFPGPPPVHFAILIFCVVLLAYLEGLQVAILALETVKPEVFEETHPRACALHKMVNEGKNVQCFLVGRQFFVIFVVYLTAQVTTYPSFPDLGMPEALFIILIETGLPGALTVLAFGQLFTQLIAATHPVQMMNMIGAYQVTQLCLGLQWFGITHFSWMIAAIGRQCFGLHGDTAFSAKQLVKEGHHGGGGFPLLDQTHSLLADIPDNEKADLPPMYDSNAEDEPVDLLSPRKERLGVYTPTPQPDRYPSPKDYAMKLLDRNQKVPRFLLPPTHPQHIPPHVVACSMLYAGTWNEAASPARTPSEHLVTVMSGTEELDLNTTANEITNTQM